MFQESLNAIGSVQLFYPLLNYLSSSQEYLDLVLNDWSQTSKNEDGSQKNKSSTARKSMFDGIYLFLFYLIYKNYF